MELSAVLSLKDKLSANMNKAANAVGAMVSRVETANSAIVKIARNRGINITATTNIQETVKAAKASINDLQRDIEQRKITLSGLTDDIDGLSFEDINVQVSKLTRQLENPKKSMEEIRKIKDDLAKWQEIGLHYESLVKAETEVEVLQKALEQINQTNVAVRAYVDFKKEALQQIYDLDNKVLKIKADIKDSAFVKKFNALKGRVTEFAKQKAQPLVGLKDNITSRLGKIRSGLAMVAGTVAYPVVKLKEYAMPILKKVGASLKSFAEKTYTAIVKVKDMATPVLKGIEKVAKGVTVAVAAGSTAVGVLVGQSVGAFADYEQLVGGVETLFKDSAPIVMQYAKDAYKTAGLSANEYMDTVTSFSASLLQSLGGDTVKAASYANLAITDMADNANKMGTSMESIQYAYQGFAKQNYTMLDNLKLGYGGTKEEMQRLLRDAEKLSGQKFDISSYADMVQAIHIVQESMGITGTTALEAEHTITGSLSSMKSAWNNMLVSLVTGGEEFDTCIENLVSSVKIFGNNIMPAIKSALSGVGRLIEEMAPIIAQELPDVLMSVIPPLISAATAIVSSLASALPGLITAILPGLLQGGLQIIGALLDVLSSNGPQLIDVLVSGLNQAVQGLLAMTPQFTTVALQLIVSLAQGIEQALPTLIPAAVNAIVSFCSGLVENIPMLVSAAIDLIMGLVDGVLQALPLLLEQGPVIISNLVNSLVAALPLLIQAGIDIIVRLAQYVIENIGLIIQAGIEIMFALITGLIGAIPSLVAAVPKLIFAIVDTIFHTNWLAVGWEIIKGIAIGIWNGAKSMVKGLWNGVKNLFFSGGKDCGSAAVDGINQGFNSTSFSIGTPSIGTSGFMTDSFTPDLGSIYGYGTTANGSLALGISNSANLPATAANGVVDNTLDHLGNVVNTSGMGVAIDTNLAAGIDENSDSVVSSVQSLADTTINLLNGLSKTSKVGAGISGNLAAGLKSSGKAAITAAGSLSEQVEAATRNAVSVIQPTVEEVSLYDTGVQIISGLISGMKSMQSVLLATATNIALSISSAINGSLEIHSPSRVTTQSGRFTGQGLANGLDDMASLVKTKALNLVGAAKSALTVTPPPVSVAVAAPAGYGNLRAAAPAATTATTNNTNNETSYSSSNSKRIIIQNLINKVVVRDEADEDRLVDKIIKRLADEVEEANDNMGEEDLD